jgi:hypothetical protein
MKRELFLGIAGLCLCSAITFAQNMVVQVPKASAAITIDGEIEEAWDAAPSFTIDKWGDDNPVPGASDFSADFKLLWNDDYLYFLGIIVDDILMDQAACSDAALQDWEVDNFEIYWSPGNSYLPDMSEMIQVRLPFANAGSDDPTATTTNGWSEDGFTITNFVSAIKANTGDGYIMEASFDLAASAVAAGKEAIAMGDTVGFNALACDNDGEATRENIGGIIEDFTWNEADTMLRLVLVEVVNSFNEVSENNTGVYPTVVTGHISFSGDDEITSVDIINMQGQVVLHAVKPSGFITVAALHSGIYNVRITTDTGSVMNQKIIKR